MVERHLKGTIINDPEWIHELGLFLSTMKDKQIIQRHKKLFWKTYLHHLKRGIPAKEAIEKTKNAVFGFRILKKN